MPRQRLALAWIACFAVLFNMLAMPMTGAMAQAANPPAAQVVWGSFCSSGGTRMIAISLSDIETNAPQNDDHSNMQHCWCCAGPGQLSALPGSVPPLYLAVFNAVPSPPAAVFEPPTPRQQWPSLNPRASPLV